MGKRKLKIYKIAMSSAEKAEKLTSPVYRRGDCFANVIRWITHNDSEDAIVVHGKVTNGKNERLDHAWIEQGNEVIDPTVDVYVDKIEFYAITKAEADAKYTSTQTLINAARTKHGGPWTRAEVRYNYLFRID